MKKYLTLSIFVLTTSVFASNPPLADDSVPTMTQPNQAPAPSDSGDDSGDDNSIDGENEDDDVIIMEEDENN